MKILIIGAIGVGVWLLLGSPTTIADLKTDVGNITSQLTGKPADATAAPDADKAAAPAPDAAAAPDADATAPAAADHDHAAAQPPTADHDADAATPPDAATPAATDPTPLPAPADTGATAGTPAPEASHSTPAVLTNPITGKASVVHIPPHAVSKTHAQIFKHPLTDHLRKLIHDSPAHKEALKHLDPTFRAQQLASLKIDRQRAKAAGAPVPVPVHHQHSASVLARGQRFITHNTHGHLESYPAGWYTSPGHHHCSPNEAQPHGVRCCCVNHSRCAFGTCGGGGTVATATSHHHARHGGHTTSQAHYTSQALNADAYDLFSYY